LENVGKWTVGPQNDSLAKESPDMPLVNSNNWLYPTVGDRQAMAFPLKNNNFHHFCCGNVVVPNFETTHLYFCHFLLLVEHDMGTRWNKFGTLFLISCDYEIIIYSHYFIHDFLLIVLGDGFKDSVFLSRSLSECPSFKSIFCELTSTGWFPRHPNTYSPDLWRIRMSRARGSDIAADLLSTKWVVE